MSSVAPMLSTPYNPYENRSYKIVISTAVGFSLATSALILRLFCRWLCHKRLELNDFFIIAAYPFKLGIDIAGIFLIKYGIGRHIQVVPLTDLRKYLQTLYVGSWVYVPCVGFTKLSILSLYWAAFPSQYIRLWSFLIGGIVTAWAIACCLVGLLACLPIHKAWDSQIPGRCIDMNAYYFGLQIPNIVTDFVILFMPFKALVDLRLGLSKTLQVSSVLAVGIVTCVFDIIRFVVLLRTPKNADLPWNQVSGSIWTDLEPSVAMLAACMPIMRPLLHPRRFLRSSNRSRQSVDLENTSKEDVRPNVEEDRDAATPQNVVHAHDQP